MFISTPRTLITCPTSRNSYSSKEKVHRPLDCPCFSREHVEKNQCISKHKQGVTDNDFPSVLALGFTPCFDPAKCRRLGLHHAKHTLPHDSSPLPHPSHPQIMAASTSPYVTLISSDGFEFIISREAACVAGTIKKMLDPQSACPEISPSPSLPPSLPPSHTERKKGKKKKGGQKGWTNTTPKLTGSFAESISGRCTLGTIKCVLVLPHLPPSPQPITLSPYPPPGIPPLPRDQQQKKKGEKERERTTADTQGKTTAVWCWKKCASTCTITSSTRTKRTCRTWRYRRSCAWSY